MNLNALSYPLMDKLKKYTTKYEIYNPALSPPTKIRKLIVLGEGTPDDLVVLLAAHQLNGTELAGIIKPPNDRGISTFKWIGNYFNTNHLKAIVFIVDQEERTLKSISTEIEKQIRKYRNDFDCSQIEQGGKLKVYKCPTDQGSQSVILAINGLTSIKTKKHMIEDHCLSAGQELNLITLPNIVEYPKDLWQIQVNAQMQEIVYHNLAQDPEFFKKHFPQQYKACEIFKNL